MNTPSVQERYAHLVARAWIDKEFKTKLLADPLAAFKECGLEFPPGKQIKVLEDTETLQHQPIPCVLPEAASLVSIAGPSADWYRQIVERARADDGFRQKLLNDPQAAYQEAGVQVPAAVNAKWVEDTEQVSHFPLPSPPSLELPADLLANVSGGVMCAVCNLSVLWRYYSDDANFQQTNSGRGCTGVRD